MFFTFQQWHCPQVSRTEECWPVGSLIQCFCCQLLCKISETRKTRGQNAILSVSSLKPFTDDQVQHAFLCVFLCLLLVDTCFACTLTIMCCSATGSSTLDHGLLFDFLCARLRKDITPFVMLLNAVDCNCELVQICVLPKTLTKAHCTWFSVVRASWFQASIRHFVPAVRFSWETIVLQLGKPCISWSFSVFPSHVTSC